MEVRTRVEKLIFSPLGLLMMVFLIGFLMGYIAGGVVVPLQAGFEIPEIVYKYLVVIVVAIVVVVLVLISAFVKVFRRR